MREPGQGRAAQGGELGAFVHGLVCATVDEHGAAGREQRDDGEVDERDRRQHERVGRAEQLGQLLLDLLVENRATEQARPARVRAPRLEVCGNGVEDLAIEVEAEVVARGEVGEPVVADADHPAVDLFDDGVRHRVRALELREVRVGIEPAANPVIARATPRFSRACRRHDSRYRPEIPCPLAIERGSRNGCPKGVPGSPLFERGSAVSVSGVPVAPGLLHRVHRCVGVFEQSLGVAAVDRGRDRCRCSHSPGSRSRRPQTAHARRIGPCPRPASDAGFAIVAEQDQELVTALTGDDIVRPHGMRCSRDPTALSRSSPAAWPKLSLTSLKLSRSMKRRAMPVPFRVARFKPNSR